MFEFYNVQEGYPKDEVYETDEMVCPHCGNVQSDTWEITGHEECGTTECGHCEKDFDWSVYHAISYTTKPPKENSDAR